MLHPYIRIYLVNRFYWTFLTMEKGGCSWCFLLRKEQKSCSSLSQSFSTMGRMWCFHLVKTQLSKLLNFSAKMFSKASVPRVYLPWQSKHVTFLLFCSSDSFQGAFVSPYSLQSVLKIPNYTFTLCIINVIVITLWKLFWLWLGSQ